MDPFPDQNKLMDTNPTQTTCPPLKPISVTNRRTSIKLIANKCYAITVSFHFINLTNSSLVRCFGVLEAMLSGRESWYLTEREKKAIETMIVILLN